MSDQNTGYDPDVVKKVKNHLLQQASKNTFMDVALLAYNAVTFKHAISGVIQFNPKELYYVVMVLLPIAMVLQIASGILNIIMYQLGKDPNIITPGNNKDGANGAESSTLQILQLVHTILAFVLTILTVFIVAFTGN